jgi:hypothetical protein
VGLLPGNAKAVANDQRGFLLSGDPRYFEEANRRIAAARAAFATADRLADPGAQRQAVRAAAAGATFGFHIRNGPKRPLSAPLKLPGETPMSSVKRIAPSASATSSSTPKGG